MNISYIPAESGNFGAARKTSAIKYLVFHYTANDGDTAEANGKYFAAHVVQASAHFFVDDNSIVQSVSTLFTAWSVGGPKWDDCGQTGGGSMYGRITNSNSISIEMCDTLRDGKYDFTEKTLQNAAELGAMLMKQYNIPPGNIYRHFDVNGKHCPGVAGWWGKDSSQWIKFKERLARTMDKLHDEQGRDNIPNDWAKDAVDWAKSNGMLFGDASGDLLLRTPMTREAGITFIYRLYKMLGK